MYVGANVRARYAFLSYSCALLVHLLGVFNEQINDGDDGHLKTTHSKEDAKRRHPYTGEADGETPDSSSAVYHTTGSWWVVRWEMVINARWVSRGVCVCVCVWWCVTVPVGSRWSAKPLQCATCRGPLPYLRAPTTGSSECECVHERRENCRRRSAVQQRQHASFSGRFPGQPGSTAVPYAGGGSGDNRWLCEHVDRLSALNFPVFCLRKERKN